MRSIMARARRTCLATVTVFGLVTVYGCGGQMFGPVEGILKMNGKPLANVQVEFLPEANGPRSMGVTDPEGKYQLTTIDNRPGALVGTHRVVLSDLQIYDDKPLPPGEKMKRDIVPIRPARFSSRYSNAGNTPLKKEVKSSPNTIDLEVTP
jgi:hypothetical protein